MILANGKADRGDFYHRPREFSKEDAAWRARLVSRAACNAAEFPSVPRDTSIEHVRNLVDDGVAYLREANRILANLHGTPHLGNKADPVDELVYIILARKTYEAAYQQAFQALKQRFATWEDVLSARPSMINRLVKSTGLAKKKTASLIGALTRLRSEFGSCTLEPTRDWSNEKLAEFLCSLPEIQRKSAYCVMMYALGRKVFPVDAHTGRVLARLGPFRELGLQLTDLDHKQLQMVLDDLVPPSLRYSLHVNLVAHGRAVCRSARPLCESCALRKMCRSYRHRAAAEARRADVPAFVDLFAGAGGLSEGFRRAGYRPLVAVEQDPMAARTYWLNHPELPDDHLLVRDMRTVTDQELRKLVGRRKVEVLLAGPPCQGFSAAGFRSKQTKSGYRFESDKRNFLFEEVIRAAGVLNPKFVVMENVPGMQSARSTEVSFLETAAVGLRGLRYETAIWRLNASAYGVPQTRLRYFLIASRTGRLPSLPEAEYRDEYAPTHDDYALPPVTLEEAIFDLPGLKPNSGEMVQAWKKNGPEVDRRFRRYLGKFGLLVGPEILFNHRSRFQNPSDLKLFGSLRPGEDSVHAIERHGLGTEMKYRRDIFDDKYHRLRPDRPSKTIVSHLARDGNGYIHPYQVRSITVREAARLQSFDDFFIFCGSPSDQWVQVGNSVPPLVGEAIARSITEVLRKRS